MDISALVPAASRVAGSVASAASSRYRPIVVARVGSAEDRAQAYRRFLDASSHFVLYVGTINGMRHDGGTAADERIGELFPRMIESGNEVAAALDTIRLCAPDYVIQQAEESFRSFPHVGLERLAFKNAGADYRTAKARFIDSARRDLAYGAAWWNVWRKAKEWWFVKKHYSKPLGTEGAAATSDGAAKPVVPPQGDSSETA
jgi:hypothetical protein